MLLARLNHGRWIADCPDCNGAELVYPGMVFRCQSHEHKVTEYAVEFPMFAETIMQLVSQRPRVNQNWLPGELLEDLLRENREHGLDRTAHMGNI